MADPTEPTSSESSLPAHSESHQFFWTAIDRRDIGKKLILADATEPVCRFLASYIFICGYCCVFAVSLFVVCCKLQLVAWAVFFLSSLIIP